MSIIKYIFLFCPYFKLKKQFKTYLMLGKLYLANTKSLVTLLNRRTIQVLK
jgi:hypothetical protein